MAVNTPVDRLMQTVRMHVPGVPEETIKLVLFNTMDEFFRRTTAWRTTQDVTLLADTTDYDIDMPVNSAVVMVIGATHNGIPVSQYDPAAGPNSMASLTFALFQPDILHLASAPSGSQLNFPLQTMFAFSVQRDVLEIDPGDWQLDDWMYDMFFNDWKNGAFAVLYGMPAKPWSNPALAVMHGKMFRQAMAQRKRQANIGFGYGQVGWRFSKWA